MTRKQKYTLAGNGMHAPLLGMLLAFIISNVEKKRVTCCSEAAKVLHDADVLFDMCETAETAETAEPEIDDEENESQIER
eukprot:11157481-Lingulodinium_polyedra.AAC.1